MNAKDVWGFLLGWFKIIVWLKSSSLMIGCKNVLSVFNDPCLRIKSKNFVWWKKLKKFRKIKTL
ncbi:hypothetical protein KVK05_00135 [Helicobacter pylori]|nr:hypothetical protein KVK05_00135 [Helicobacter pylori]